MTEDQSEKALKKLAEEARRGPWVGDTTTRIRKAAGSTASAQSTIVLAEENIASRALMPKSDGIK